MLMQLSSLALSAASLLFSPSLPATPRDTAHSSPSEAVAGNLISFERADTYSKSLLDSVWKVNKVPQYISPVRYGVEVYEVMYWTRWHDGSPIRASGLYYLPLEKRDALPLVCFNRGSKSE